MSRLRSLLLLLLLSRLAPAASVNPYESDYRVWGRYSNLDRPVVGVAAGNRHSVAVQDDGRVVAWGSFWQGADLVPFALDSVVAVAAGATHSVALRRDGRVVVWGDASAVGIPQQDAVVRKVPAGLDRVVSISAGYRITAALRDDGSMVLWGGDVDKICLPDSLRFSAVSLGGSHILAIRRSDSLLVARGSDAMGAGSVPVGLGPVIAIAAGYSHSLAVTGDGRVVAWGDSAAGQTRVPSDLGPVVSVAAGDRHSMALLRDGTVRCWGGDSLGQSSPPPGLDHVVAIAAGGAHSLALKDDGSIVAWGWNFYGQSRIPAGMRNVRSVAMGETDAMFLLRDDGTVYAWGDDAHGQTDVPAGLADVVAVSTGGYTSLALRRDGSLVLWGVTGKLAAQDPAPKVISAVAGSGGALVVLADGRLRVWDSTGLHSAGMDSVSFLQIQATPGNLFALSVDGVVYRKEFSGSWVRATSDSGFVGISSNLDHVLLARADGSVGAWDDTMRCSRYAVPARMCQNSVPADLGPVRAVAAGYRSDAALGMDSIVRVWGELADSGFAVPQGLRPVIALSSGNSCYAAVFAHVPVGVSRDVQARDRLDPGGYELRLRTLDGRLAWSGRAHWNGNVWTGLPHGDGLRVVQFSDGNRIIQRTLLLKP